MIRDYGVTDGHGLYSLHRFRPDVRHMVVFDDLVEREYHRVRLYLTEEAYRFVVQAAARGILRIVHHEQIVEGNAEALPKKVHRNRRHKSR